MSDTGGGHRSAAEAIAEATVYLYGVTFQIEIVDALANHFPRPLNQIGRLYAPVIRRVPWLWSGLWRLTDSPLWARRLFALLHRWVAPSLCRLFLAARPDVVVSVHPVFNHLGLWALRQIGRPAPMVTVVTDLVRVHPFWLCPEIDLCLTSTKPARRDALRQGMPPERVEVTGLPVSLAFRSEQLDRRQARERLGLPSRLPAILLMGGGEGVGRLYETARRIARTRLPAQMVVIAGRNLKLRRRLDAVGWEIPTRVAGFVDDVPQWMAAADVLVTKAGPGVLSEAFIAGLPLVLSGAIPGQEVPNVDYVVKQGAGIAEADPARITGWLAERLRPEDEELTRMADAARSLARPDAALTAARRISELLLKPHMST